MALTTADLSRARLKPYQHQIVGVNEIVSNPYYFLMDEMGAGKTKQTIDAAQILAELGVINQVIVIAPAPVRSVWFDPELGELSKHLWAHFPCNITEYHGKSRTWSWFVKYEGKTYTPKLNWLITNYDFIRNKERMKFLIKQCNKKTLLVLDESSAIANASALQTKACEEIRSYCGRVLLLNGTPITNNPGNLYSQAHIMNPAILGCKTYFHFRARYAVMGGWQNKVIIKWINIPDLQERLAPYSIRRLKIDCLDLPEKLDPVSIYVPMDNTTWTLYKQMRDDMVAWLNDTTLSSAAQAIVKAIRLAQICSGFIGGVEEQTELTEDLLDMQEGRPDFIEKLGLDPILPKQEGPVNPVQEISREKLDAFLDWFKDRLAEDPKFKLIVWCRFRAEVKRLADELKKACPSIDTGLIWGGQKRDERNLALRLLDPRTTPDNAVVVIGTPASGSMGLNLTAANYTLYMSNDFSLKTRLQSEDRNHRPGQTRAVWYGDMIATGPQGQKTIDHHIVKALHNKEDLANMTTEAWVRALTEE